MWNFKNTVVLYRQLFLIKVKSTSTLRKTWLIIHFTIVFGILQQRFLFIRFKWKLCLNLTSYNYHLCLVWNVETCFYIISAFVFVILLFRQPLIHFFLKLRTFAWHISMASNILFSTLTQNRDFSDELTQTDNFSTSSNSREITTRSIWNKKSEKIKLWINDSILRLFLY
jgi:hypothetical protein